MEISLQSHEYVLWTVSQVRFTHPLRAVTPGQALVLYDGDVCLGASILSYPGPSLFEQRLGECNQGAILMS